MKFLFFILVLAVVIVFATWVVQWSWALVMPAIFGLKYLSFTEALGLWVLCTSLFGSGGSLNSSRK